MNLRFTLLQYRLKILMLFKFLIWLLKSLVSRAIMDHQQIRLLKNENLQRPQEWVDWIKLALIISQLKSELIAAEERERQEQEELERHKKAIAEWVFLSLYYRINSIYLECAFRRSTQTRAWSFRSAIYSFTKLSHETYHAHIICRVNWGS